MTLTLRDWYRVGRPDLPDPLGVFVVVTGDNPVGMVPLLFARKSKQWVNGAASCTRYLTMGDPGASQVTEAEGVRLLESFGGSLAGLQTEIARMATVIQHPSSPASA